MTKAIPTPFVPSADEILAESAQLAGGSAALLCGSNGRNFFGSGTDQLPNEDSVAASVVSVKSGVLSNEHSAYVREAARLVHALSRRCPDPGLEKGTGARCSS